MRPKPAYPTWGSELLEEDAALEHDEPRREQSRRKRSHRTSRRRTRASAAARPRLGIAGRRHRRFNW